jgi:hypothetical protein
MNFFPIILNSNNKLNFSDIYFSLVKKKLRKNLFEHIISHTENDYYSLDEFSNKFNYNIDIVKKAVKDLIQELEKLNWKCALSFGDTGLFIYKDNPPVNLWK